MSTQQMKTSIGLKLLFGSFIVIGLITTLSHYFAPRPSATASSVDFFPIGPEWFLEQLPRYDLLPITTFLHLAPAGLFMLMLIFQLSQDLRKKWTKLHRILGYIISILGISFAISGFVLGVKIPFGGNVELIASTIVAIIFLYTLYKGIFYARAKKIKAHRIWMLRMVAVSFAPLSMRLIMIPIGFMQVIEIKSIFGLLLLTSAAINLIILEIFILKKSQKLSHQFNEIKPIEVSTK